MSKNIVLLQTLVSTLNQFLEQVAGMDKRVAQQSPTPTSWSINDIVQHFIHVETEFLARLKRIVVGDRPFLPYIHPDKTHHTSQASLDELVNHFTAQRNQTIAYLNQLTAADWEKTAVHETEGEATLSFFVQMIIDHDRDHISQLMNLQEQVRKEPV